MQFKFDEIPVSAKLEATVKASLAQVKYEQRKNSRKKIWISCSSLAAAFAAAIIFCVSNPALAAKLPIIGSIFADLEDDFAYAGDYSDRAQILTQLETLPSAKTPDSEDAASPEDTAVPETRPYSVTDNGITLTASEIYSDGLSVFLSLQIHSEEPFGFNYKDTETGEFARDESGNLIPLPATIYPIGQAYIDTEEVIFDSTELFVEQLDEHNFNGIIKTDLPDSMFGSDGTHTMRISLRRFSADFCDAEGNPIVNGNTVGDVALQINGSWELELPFLSDTSRLQAYNNLASSDEPCQITDVYVSPYQVIVKYSPGPDEWTIPDQAGVVCFDENGTCLSKGNQYLKSFTDAFSLNKTQPSELHFYVLEDWITSCKTRDEETARELAINSLALPLSW